MTPDAIAVLIAAAAAIGALIAIYVAVEARAAAIVAHQSAEQARDAAVRATQSAAHARIVADPRPIKAMTVMPIAQTKKPPEPEFGPRHEKTTTIPKVVRDVQELDWIGAGA